jgi:polyisoprenoid-binding protein YceI
MKKFVIILTAFIALTAFTKAVSTWQNDDPHSQLGFTVTHLGISDISGTFNDFDVTIQSSKPDFSDATFQMTAKAASIDTRVDARNNHLRSADFFDVAKYPELSFTSTSLKKKGKNKYAITGDLTLHGITKPVTMNLVFRGTTVNLCQKQPPQAFNCKV